MWMFVACALCIVCVCCVFHVCCMCVVCVSCVLCVACMCCVCVREHIVLGERVVKGVKGGQSAWVTQVYGVFHRPVRLSVSFGSFVTSHPVSVLSPACAWTPKLQPPQASGLWLSSTQSQCLGPGYQPGAGHQGQRGPCPKTTGWSFAEEGGLVSE